tara:strand:+ start:1560 stop:1976 length:417 start_codon:yes stop_codon:yes gene_type:complete
MEIALFIAAAAQLVIAVLNLFLVRIMKWEEPVAQMPQLVRDVFHVHSCFITITLVIFGVVTIRFAGELAAGTNDLGRWLVCGIGLFWLIRWVMQFFFYSSSHWKGKRAETAVHIVLILTYGFFAGVYLLAAFGNEGYS